MRVVIMVACLVVGTSCGSVFDLEMVTPPPECPTPRGHDEDGDRFDDGCDVCPGFADPGQGDSDDDGIGDACDPSPATGGDTLVRFMSFATADDAAYWQMRPLWTIDGDAFRFAGGMSLMELRGTAPAFPFELQLSATLLSVERSQYEHVFMHGDHGGTTPPHCAFIHTSVGGDYFEASPNTAGRVEMPASYTTGTSYVVRMTYTATDLLCQLEGRTATGDELTASASLKLTNPAPGNVALGIDSTQVEFAWFAIYKLP